jgi:hypothetical protein
MGDRSGSSSRVRTSEDKVHRKDLCWSVREVHVLGKRLDLSGPDLEEVGRYILWCLYLRTGLYVMLALEGLR